MYQLSGEDKWGLYWNVTYFADIHRIFKVPYDELTNIMYVMSKELNMSYADFNSMPFFEILLILETYKNNMEEQKKQQDEENDIMEQRMNNMQSQFNMNNMQNQMPKFEQPSFNLPNI